MINELLKSNLTLRIVSSLLLAGVTIFSLFHGSPLFETLLFFVFLLLMFELRRLPFRAQGYFFVGLYSIISFLSVYWLSKEVYLLFFLFCIVWSSDIGAYCAGKFFGGPKVLPKVSPNKTWAGVFGACILTLFVTRLFVDYYLIPNEIRVAPVNFQILDTDVLVLSLIFSLLSQIGDFLQSYIKRQLGIKDTGSLIPGHGGLFDRLDGLMFVAPIFALFIYYL